MSVILAFLNKTVAKVLGLFAIVLSVFSYGYFKGRKTEKNISLKSENMRQDAIIDSLATDASKQKKLAEKVANNDNEAHIKIDSVKKEKKYNVGKWIIFIFIFISVSCVNKEYIKVPCPSLYKIQRPNLVEADIYVGMTLDNSSFNAIVTNMEMLKATIMSYENAVDIFNADR